MTETIRISVKYVLATAIFILCVTNLVSFLSYMSIKLDERQLPQRDTFASCIPELSKFSSIDAKNRESFVEIWNICNRQIYETLAFDDYAIRRDKFRRQEFDERVNLWLVVAITISGICLAYVQILLSYKAKIAGKEFSSTDTKFIVEQNKISLQSSIAGIAILAISLVFFFVYVKWIYLDQDVGGALAISDYVLPPPGHQFAAAGKIDVPDLANTAKIPAIKTPESSEKSQNNYTKPIDAPQSSSNEK